MTSVIVVNEDQHGVIGIAKDYKNAIKYLVVTHWLIGLTEIYIDGKGWTSLYDNFGDDWQTIIENWSLKQFNEYFLDSFFLEEMEVFEK